MRELRPVEQPVKLHTCLAVSARHVGQIKWLFARVFSQRATCAASEAKQGLCKSRPAEHSPLALAAHLHGTSLAHARLYGSHGAPAPYRRGAHTAMAGALLRGRPAASPTAGQRPGGRSRWQPLRSLAPGGQQEPRTGRPVLCALQAGARRCPRMRRLAGARTRAPAHPGPAGRRAGRREGLRPARLPPRRPPPRAHPPRALPAAERRRPARRTARPPPARPQRRRARGRPRAARPAACGSRTPARGAARRVSGGP